MSQVKLTHITDLHLLDHKDLEQFILDLPGMVIALRIAARTSLESGVPLSKMFPSFVFDNESSDSSKQISQVVIRLNGKEIRADNAKMILDAYAQQQVQAAVFKAKKFGP